MTIFVLSPVPYKTFSVSSGNVYVADQFGIIASVVSTADQAELVAAGCATLNPNPTDLLGKLLGANFNVTTDQEIPLNNSIRFRITRIVVLNTTVPGMGTAAGGLYTLASKAGTAIVAAAQVYTGLTNAATALNLTVAVPNLVQAPASRLFFSLTTPQGAAALADIYVYGDAMP